jgi:hypothetical protein
MSNLLVASFVPPDAGNEIAVAIVGSDGPEGTEAPITGPITVGQPFVGQSAIGQSTSASPALAYAVVSLETLAGGGLWCAFRGNADTDTAIYVATSTNWANHLQTGQRSKLAPALTMLGGSLWVAYVGEGSGHVELVSSADNGATWSKVVDTGQPSNIAPAVTNNWGTLVVAYVNAASGHIEVISSADNGTTWSAVADTGRSSDLAPALESYNGGPSIAYVGQATGHVEVISSADGQSWSTSSSTGQKSKLAPALVNFDDELWVGYVGEGSGHLELVGPGWSPRIDTGQPSASAPALAVVPDALVLVPGVTPGYLGGNQQYVFVADGPIMDLKVEIAVTQDIVVSPTSGNQGPNKPPLPVGFQINGVPPTEHQTPGDQAVGWQQYAIKMWPGQPVFQTWAQGWPYDAAGISDVYLLFQPDNYTVTLPNNLTIPAGWTIVFDFTQQADGTITGFDCRIIDNKTNTIIQPELNVALKKGTLADGQNVGEGQMARLQAFNVVLVAYFDSNNATMNSGAGTITITSSTPLTPQVSWPQYGQTGENANSTYAQLPAWSSTSITQAFGVAAASS